MLVVQSKLRPFLVNVPCSFDGLTPSDDQGEVLELEEVSECAPMIEEEPLPEEDIGSHCKSLGVRLPGLIDYP